MLSYSICMGHTATKHDNDDNLSKRRNGPSLISQDMVQWRKIRMPLLPPTSSTQILNWVAGSKPLHRPRISCPRNDTKQSCYLSSMFLRNSVAQSMSLYHLKIFALLIWFFEISHSAIRWFCPMLLVAQSRCFHQESGSRQLGQVLLHSWVR